MWKHPTRLFYSDPSIQSHFRAAVAAVVGRTNSISGLPYAHDPTILAWELANEPRCEGPGGAAVLQEWVASTSSFVRSLDPQHLITLGLEGFLGPSTPELHEHNPYSTAANHGADFLALCSLPCIDLACIHLYPDQWCPLESSPAQLKSFMRGWLHTHAALCGGRLGKPLALTEFGKREPRSYHGRDCAFNMDRTQVYEEVLDCCLELAAGGGPLAGVCAWMLAARQYPDYDGYTLKLRPEPPPKISDTPSAAALAAEPASPTAAAAAIPAATFQQALQAAGGSTPASASSSTTTLTTSSSVSDSFHSAPLPSATTGSGGGGRRGRAGGSGGGGRRVGRLRSLMEHEQEGLEGAGEPETRPTEAVSAPLEQRDRQVPSYGAIAAGACAAAVTGLGPLLFGRGSGGRPAGGGSSSGGGGGGGAAGQKDEPAVEALRQYGEVMRRLASSLAQQAPPPPPLPPAGPAAQGGPGGGGAARAELDTSGPGAGGQGLEMVGQQGGGGRVGGGAVGEVSDSIRSVAGSASRAATGTVGAGPSGVLGALAGLFSCFGAPHGADGSASARGGGGGGGAGAGGGLGSSRRQG
ncbi:hypothetical protein HYH03_007895 [Edaphochlamys debaryana]|uniref:mannan endo-1,4-beta-mannosidase n=1 Tax=Edaphochlamys debaryana TaxID=47281 RepID=A0A835Y199_9CHLO|nr:hypothetical protein HYH03_007895 [Edaphochlamys debaryana]|eukprot:KAG2493965.1 hypothetical protein HYH03_007895 [Edaphochlamys debaryana]